MSTASESPSFLARVGLAFRLLGNAELAGKAARALVSEEPAKPAAAPVPKSVEKTLPPERVHASGLALLGLLQREGRLVDFLQEEVAPFSDAEIGAAARVVHGGCRKVLGQYLTLAPAMPGSDGSAVTLQPGYDSQRVRLAGNVTGQPPHRGVLRHHGWVATEVRLPVVSEAIDPSVIAPAEVEL
jgi:hypothetical protein